jgi:ABC-type glycerol-3-phosphate transport system substrate-binding protein
MITFRTRIVAVTATALVLAACGEQSASVTAPDNARYDGGFTFGGGNRSDSTSTTTTTASSGEGAVVNAAGGFTFGGGN